jgi:hypothetical protein
VLIIARCSGRIREWWESEWGLAVVVVSRRREGVRAGLALLYDQRSAERGEQYSTEHLVQAGEIVAGGGLVCTGVRCMCERK